ncbi:MAG: RNA polymerase-associated protein RapA, partial [Halieaceae bacterium]|nr:RNA polymerase-associated protein RapA [Halieaceae bacterium]
PLSPMRLLVDARGKDLAALLPRDRLNEMVQSVKKATALAIIKQVYQEVEAKMSLATAAAEQQLASIAAEAEHTMRLELGEELDRLRALRRVNPSIREEEISFLQHRIDECAVHIQHASLQLQALRLIITT